ncbi:right-handed parallel beta-helix repeat-containing protein [Thermodesulfobacteriota bacterium]
MEGEWHLYLGDAPDGSTIISPWTELPSNTKANAYALRGDKAWAYEQKPVFQLTVEYEDGSKVCDISTETNFMCEFTTRPTVGRYRAILKLVAGNGLKLLNYGEYPSIDQFDLRPVGNYGITALYKKNITIRNGKVIQGGAKSYKGHSIYFYGGDGFTLSNVTTYTDGVEASSLETNYSPNITVDSCNMTNRSPVKFNRHQLSGAVSIIHGDNVNITKNSIDSGSAWGCIYLSNSNQNISYNNLKTTTSTTNHFAVYVFSDSPITNIKIHNNTIEAIGGSANGGIGLGGAPDGVQIYNNTITIPKTDVSIENEGGYGAFGIMLKDYKNQTCKNVNVHDNNILLIGTYDDHWDGTPFAGGNMSGIMNMCTGGNVVFASNTITGMSIKPDVIVSGIEPGGQTDYEVTFINNTIKSDSRIINLGGYAGQGDIVGNVKFISNTFIKGKNLIEFHTFEGARLYNIFTDNYHFINTFLEGTLSLDDFSQGHYNYNFYVDWYLDINVKNSSSDALSGAIISITDKNNSIVFEGKTDSKGSLRKIPITEFQVKGTGNKPNKTIFTPHVITITHSDKTKIVQEIYMNRSKIFNLQINTGATIENYLPNNTAP